MVRAPCCQKTGLKKGPWTPEEDKVLVSHIQQHGHGNWRALPKLAGLLRCGKSCRLRWINYLRPDIKRGNFTREEEDAIIELHKMLGNRWSAIAAKLPGRTDNEIKNVWHTHLKKRLNEASPKRKSSSRRKSQPSNAAPTIPVSSEAYCGTSPQPLSSDMSSVTETSTAMTGENNSSEFKSRTTDSSMESFPMIDESFWTDPIPSSSSGEPSDSTALSINTEQIQFPFTDWMDIHTEELLRNGNHGANVSDDGMEFWYDLFLGAGGNMQELPDF